MKLRFLGTVSTGGDSPTLYATDRDSYIVQGWKIGDAIRPTNLRSDETCVEIYARLLDYLAHDGVAGPVTPSPAGMPIVTVTDSGNLVMKGQRVTDTTARDQMAIPDHEDCVEISRADMRSLLEGSHETTDESGA